MVFAETGFIYRQRPFVHRLGLFIVCIIIVNHSYLVQYLRIFAGKRLELVAPLQSVTGPAGIRGVLHAGPIYLSLRLVFCLLDMVYNLLCLVQKTVGLFVVAFSNGL